MGTSVSPCRSASAVAGGTRAAAAARSFSGMRASASDTDNQGLTLVLFSAQRKRLLWNWGCIWGLFTGCLGGVCEVLGGVGGCQGCILSQKRLRLS